MTTERDHLSQLERQARPLDPGATRRRRLRHAILASGERFLRTLRSRKGFEAGAGTGEGLLDAPIGERGRPIDQVIRLLEREVFLPGANPAAGTMLAYIPGGNQYHAALGDYLAAVTDKYPGIFFTGPGPVRMENVLLRWTADLVGYPAGAGGNLASGGSLANLIAVVTAREAHRLRSAEYPRSVVYLTRQAHQSIDKALRIAGMGEAPLRHVALDQRFRMRPEALAGAIAADRAAGLTPWLVVSNAGAVDTGAVDPLDAIATIAERERCWHHVDAAYGGFFLLTDHGRRIMHGIHRADSVTLDPHKSLFLPWGSGIVLVRDRDILAAAHRYAGHYMQDAVRDPNQVSPADVSPELTKHFRALRMWLPLVTLGTAPFRASLEEKLLLARYFHGEVAALGFETGPPPDLSISTFRWAPRGAGPEQVNRLNQAIIEGVRRDGRVFLSSTMLDERYTLRMAALSFRTHRREIDLALRVLREQAAALA